MSDRTDNRKQPGWLEMYLASARVGALTFGGGYAMLPILQREVVEKKGWVSEEEVLDYYALAQCLPGILMVNTLSFMGRKLRGPLGALVSALGAVTPSLIIILIIAMLLSGFAEVPAVQHAFAGIRVCVCVLIFNSVVKLWKSSVKDAFCVALLLAVAAGSLFLDLSPVLFVVLAALLGILVYVFILKKHLAAGAEGGEAR